jgi:type IV pilus assembly protein PilY1
MKRRLLLPVILFVFCFLNVAAVYAAPDQFLGDSVIYGGSAATIRPNVLVILDDSQSMDQDLKNTGAKNGAYSMPSLTVYPDSISCGTNGLTSCGTTSVYNSSDLTLFTATSFATCTLTTSKKDDTVVTAAMATNFMSQINSLSTSTLGYATAPGPYWNANGTCCAVKNTSATNCSSSKPCTNGVCSSTLKIELGNYINWQTGASKMDIAKDVLKDMVANNGGINFGLMRYHYKNGNGYGAEFISSTATSTATPYVSTIKKMDDLFLGSITNQQALINLISGPEIVPVNDTPLAESLFEAMRYYQGGQTAYGNTVGVSGGKYTSPISYSCQKNYVILITDGESTADKDATSLGSICTAGDCDGDGQESSTKGYKHSLDDVAKYMYEQDISSGQSGTQSVSTFIIGFGVTSGGTTSAGLALMQRAVDSNHGRGQFYDAEKSVDLSSAISSIMSSINIQNTSFVSPVVPVSPENKTYTGSRIYMGFFMPNSGSYWYGNLKKYGLSDSSYAYGADNILDKNGNLATFVSSNGTSDDRDGAALVDSTGAKVPNGSFRPSSVSYWFSSPTNSTSITSDGSNVTLGGAGQILQNRSFTASSTTGVLSGSTRTIYTYTGTSYYLNDSSNAFKVTNSSITSTLLGLPGSVTDGIPPGITSTPTTTDVKQLINYISGIDVYDDNSNGNYTEKRSWIFGDVFHSKPAIVTYAKYTYSTDETTCSKNQTMIYVGTNDGMLHAIRDCDGSELWSFIPPGVLPYLQYMTGIAHTAFVDSSVVAYTFDKSAYNSLSDDGALSSGNGDAVILVFGLRRGGGTDIEPNQGFYYAVDVTSPDAPKLIWGMPSTSGFSDMGEAWSEPKIGKILDGTTVKIAAFLGGGYDDCHEDARYGAVQSFPSTCVGLLETADAGVYSSASSSTVGSFPTGSVSNAYKGRAVYIVQIGTISGSQRSGNAAFSATSQATPNIIQKLTGFDYAVTSEILAMDTNGDGYVDRLYAGDTGGGLYRIDMSSATKSNWKVTKIFNANGASSTDVGRKIFYRPTGFVSDFMTTSSGTVQPVVRLYFGTGDREHPLNLAVTDRMYEVIDKGQTSAKTESDLIDVTTDQMQLSTSTISSATVSAIQTADNPSDTTKYGWFITLDSDGFVSTPGQKVLAASALANGVVYFTTYTPNSGSTSTAIDACSSNLGIGRVYALNYDNGDAAINYYKTNDIAGTTVSNSYASGGVGVVLQRQDRMQTVGTAIPSAPVVLDDKVVIGCGGGICISQTGSGAYQTIPLYWRIKTK